MNKLNGKKILLTRAQDNESKFENILISLGASVERLPVIEIKPLNSFSELDKRIALIESYDGMFFTSSNAVKYFFERLIQKKKEFSGKIFAVGSKTKASVESYGYKVYFAPQVFSSEELADTIDINEVKGKKFLFPKGNLAGDTLKNRLGKIAEIDEVVVYETVLPDADSNHVNEIKKMLGAGEIDCISFFSPSSIENFLKIFPELKQKEIKIAVIGKTTSKSAAEHGLNVDIIPGDSTAESLAEAITEYFSKE